MQRNVQLRCSNWGFTLLELLIVIAIIGLLAAVLIPNLIAGRARANDTAAAGCAKQIATGQEMVFIDSGAYAVSLDSLNAATDGTASNCGATWVDDAPLFTASWAVQHPSGSGLIYSVGPGGIVPPP